MNQREDAIGRSAVICKTKLAVCTSSKIKNRCMCRRINSENQVSPTNLRERNYLMILDTRPETWMLMYLRLYQYFDNTRHTHKSPGWLNKTQISLHFAIRIACIVKCDSRLYKFHNVQNVRMRGELYCQGFCQTVIDPALSSRSNFS